MKTIYESKVKVVGGLVDDFEKEGIFVTFGEPTPDTLKDFCYIIEIVKVEAELEVGQKVVISELEYEITAIGSNAQRNLDTLGHVTFAFTGKTEAEMPGTIYLNKTEVPKLAVGDKIAILA